MLSQVRNIFTPTRTQPFWLESKHPELEGFEGINWHVRSPQIKKSCFLSGSSSCSLHEEDDTSPADQDWDAQYSVLCAQYSVLSAQCSVLSAQCSVLSSRTDSLKHSTFKFFSTNLFQRAPGLFLGVDVEWVISWYISITPSDAFIFLLNPLHGWLSRSVIGRGVTCTIWPKWYCANVQQSTDSLVVQYLQKTLPGVQICNNFAACLDKSINWANFSFSLLIFPQCTNLQ